MDETDRSVSARASAGIEEPTDKAEMTIMLVDLAGQREPVYWRAERVRFFRRERFGWHRPGWVRRPRIRTSRPVGALEEIPQPAVSDPAGRLPAGSASSQDSDWVRGPVEVTGEASDVFLTALYLEAERTCLPNESPYDVDRGLQRFRAWLEDEVEPPGETSC